MAKTTEFRIQINGIEESISAIEELNKRLDDLEARINNLQNRQVNINASYTSQGGGGSTSRRASQLSEEEKLTRQILQLDEKRTVYQQQLYQSYLASKDLMKETLQDQKQIAASERLTAQQYTNTMAGMKQHLADIKTVMQTVDLSDTDQFDKLTQKANELISKLKEIEESYGQFGRNVGNYANGVAEGINKAFGGIEITIDGVTRKYDSLRQATVSLKNELGVLEYQEKQNTTQYKQITKEIEKLEKAQLRVNSAMNDAKASSKGMDDMLDMMESFVAVNQATRGMSSLFGIDTSKIQESIQKLVGLQNALQGIEKIRQQLNTQEGLGKYFASANKQIDTMNFSLKRTIVSLYGTGTAARFAAVGVNALSAGIKMLGVGLVVGAITLLVEGISKLSKSIQDWVKGNADLVSSERLTKNAIEQTNDELERNLQLLQEKHNAGRLTSMQMELQSEEAYAKALSDANDQLERQLQLSSKRGQNKAFANTALGNTSIIGNTGVTTFGGIGHRGMDEEIKSMEDLEKRYKLLVKAVEEGKGVMENANSEFGRISLSASDARDELNNMEQLVAGDLILSFRKFDISTQQGRRAFADFVQNIRQNGTELQKSVLFNMGDILSDKEPELVAALNGYLRIVNRFSNQFNSLTEDLKAEKFLQNIIDSADPNSSLKKSLEETRAIIKNEDNKYSAERVEQAKKAEQVLLKQLNENSRKKVNTIRTNSRREQSTAEEAQRKINELTISLMKDGLLKQLRQLDEQNRQEMNKIRQNGKRVEELMKLQAQKYQQQRQEIIDEYNKELTEKNIDLSFKIDDTEIERLQIVNDALKETSMILPQIADSSEFFKDFSRLGVEISKLEGSVKVNFEAQNDLPEVLNFAELLDKAKYTKEFTEYHNFLMNFMSTLDEDVKNELNINYQEHLRIFKEELGDDTKATELAKEKLMGSLEKMYKEMHAESYKFIEKYGINLVDQFIGINHPEDEELLSESIKQQQTLIDNYYNTIGNTILENISGIYSKRREAIEKEELKETSQITMSISDSLKELTKDNTFDDFSKDIQRGVSNTLIALSKLQDALNNNEIDKDTYTEQYRNVIDQEKKRLEGRLNVIKEYKPKIEKELNELNEKRERGEVDEKTYKAQRETYQLIIDNIDTFERQITETQQRYANQRNRLTQDEAKSTNEIVSEWLNRIVNEYRAAISKINSLMSKSSNGGGFMNTKAIRSQLKEALNALRTFRSNVETQLSQLEVMYSQGAVMPDEYTSAKSNLSGLLSSANDMISAIDDRLDEATKILKQKINQQVQIWGQALVDIMGSIGDIQDSMLERELEELDEYNEKLEEKLQKQKDITQRYADDVKGIEDELETARGDRRQYLIDQLNEQMRAQRESLAQEQQIEKEQEKLEAKKKKLEDDANKRRKKQAITTALINAALAISNAAVNIWPQPALSMIAAATITTAAQIAAIRAAKYEKGGLLKGKSHRDGGIPVGNTGIEVEGKEYIIRKESTTPNIDLLNYINRSKRKLSLDDFIDFYGTKKMSNIIDSSKPRYASGGQLPTLRTDINTDTRMMQQMEQWNNRPVVVEVKEIINKADILRKTQVLAGLNPKTL